MFQSLIGRLKTRSLVQLVDDAHEFQSLIGRLKTRCALGCLRGSTRFQSLIGRLKTVENRTTEGG